MKITEAKGFLPVTITLTTPDEVDTFWALLVASERSVCESSKRVYEMHGELRAGIYSVRHVG